MIHIINSSFFVLKITISQLKPTELTPRLYFLILQSKNNAPALQRHRNQQNVAHLIYAGCRIMGPKNKSNSPSLLILTY